MSDCLKMMFDSDGYFCCVLRMSDRWLSWFDSSIFFNECSLKCFWIAMMIVSSLMPLFAQKKPVSGFIADGASGLPPPRFSPQLCWRWMWSFSVGFDDQRCRLNWRKLIVIPSDLSPRGSPPTLCWSWMWSSSVGFDDQRFQSYLNCCVFSLHFEPAVLVFFLPFWHC